MPNQNIKPDLKEVVFSKDEKFTSEFVTGVYGGLATNGTISVNFFRDKLVLPDKIYFEIDHNNKVIKENKKVGGKHIDREIFFEAILDINTAKTTVDWLIRQIAEHEKSVKK